MFENVEVTKLPNGARIATMASPDANSCAVGFSINVGSRFEKAAEAGASHFLEHMLFKGSAKRPTAARINRTLDRMGGYSNAYTGLNWTSFRGFVPSTYAREIVDVFGDMLAHPILDPAEIENERRVILEEINRNLDSPGARLHSIAMKALWPNHPIGRPTIGTPRTLAKMDADTLRAFHRKHYTARGALLVAAGKVRHEQIVDWARPYFEALPSTPVPRRPPAPQMGSVVPVVCERGDIAQARVQIMFRGPGRKDSRKATLSLLSYILGGGSDSRLFRKIRERDGLAYHVDAFVRTADDKEEFCVEAEVNPDRIEKAVRQCGRELRELASRPTGRRELGCAKRMLTNMNLLAYETIYDKADYLDYELKSQRKAVVPKERHLDMEPVSGENIRVLAEEVFRPENGSLALMLPNDCPAHPKKLHEILWSGWRQS